MRNIASADLPVFDRLQAGSTTSRVMRNAETRGASHWSSVTSSKPSLSMTRRLPWGQRLPF
jgi:hypothetical protein